MDILEVPGTVYDSHDFNASFGQLVDYAVILVNPFPKSIFTVFRDDPTNARMLAKILH